MQSTPITTRLLNPQSSTNNIDITNIVITSSNNNGNNNDTNDCNKNNELLTSFIKECKWNEALSYLNNNNDFPSTTTTTSQSSKAVAEINTTNATTYEKESSSKEVIVTTTTKRPTLNYTSSIVINAFQKNAPHDLLIQLIDFYKDVLMKENPLILHEACSSNNYSMTIHEKLLHLDEEEKSRSYLHQRDTPKQQQDTNTTNYQRATLVRDVDGQVPLHILIRRVFESTVSNTSSIEEQMCILESYIKSCPESCSIADYRDYEETPLVLLLKVNSFRSMSDNYMKVERLVLRILKCMLDVNPNSGNTTSHVFQYTPLHSAVYHGSCFEIVQLLLDNYNHHTTNNKKKAITSFISTRFETPLHFACMRNENERVIQLLTNTSRYNFLNTTRNEMDGLGLSALHWLWIRFISNSFSVVNNTSTTTTTRGCVSDGNTITTTASSEDMIRDSFPFPFDGLNINQRNNYVHRDTTITAQQGDVVIDAEYYNWIQKIDPSEDYRHMRFIPHHYNDINEPSAKFIARVLLRIQEKIVQSSTDNNKSNQSLQHFFKTHNLSNIEIKISLFWRKVLFFLQSNSDNDTATTASVSSTSNSFKKRKITTSSNDNNNSYILHTIASTTSVPTSIFKIAYSLNPISIQKQDSPTKRLPLHYACIKNPSLTEWYKPRNNHSSSDLSNGNNPIVEENIIDYTVSQYPQATKCYDVYNRLPLHYAIENTSVKYSSIYNLIIHFPSSLERKDGILKLYPFMIAACKNNNDPHRYNGGEDNENDVQKVNTCFEILKMCPNLVSTGII